ncbi:protoporphyrinogen oxidase [Granulicella sp. dw_53]|uniref:protoporphyrinogen oxidase n=1 Tax=Granulicella sp. dw_53 TaxID=2719792 RepID=UPI001BD27CE1|nr:protoporphyrinogen oxidase [Granulicella sp. dw_53]
MRRIAIIGGGIAGVTAAYELARLARDGAAVEATLFESSSRLGGIVETIREGGFIIEGGPDGWVTEKPWARELAEELGLSEELLPSNDATRRTYILKDDRLQAIPDGMRMMVPTDLAALDESSLFTSAARQSFRDEPSRAQELKASAPATDESVADFVRRHFGPEVLHTIAAPLLSGVFGGDVATLSVRAVMAPFVAMEREHGSLITALQSRAPKNGSNAAIFTTLRSGLATLIERMVATVPPTWLRMNSNVAAIGRDETGWTVRCSGNKATPEHFDELMIATPVDIARSLLAPHDSYAAGLLKMEASSAVIIAFALPDASRFPVPSGFGFLVPPHHASTNGSEGLAAKTPSRLLAGTFTDQKFNHRVPSGARLVRAFFGGPTAERMMGCGNDEIASVARLELARILGPLPDATITVVRRWPRSLPQYSVGHLERMAELNNRVAAMPGLHLLGNGYRGVGLPDLVRDARSAARGVISS